MDEIRPEGRGTNLSAFRAVLSGTAVPKWNRRDICEAYAVLFFISAVRAVQVRKCGRETYTQLRRIGFNPAKCDVFDLTPNGLAIFAAAHKRERGSPMDCLICHEHTLRYPCPYT
jgi:hypothetical protein